MTKTPLSSFLLPPGEPGVFGVAKTTGVTEVGFGPSGCGVFGAHPEAISLDDEIVPTTYKTFGAPGAGIYGWGEAGYGGVFSSDKRAQIRLLPKLDHKPPEGGVGDLIVIIAKRPTSNPDITEQVAELWLCVRSGNSNEPAWWRPVLLGKEEQAHK